MVIRPAKGRAGPAGGNVPQQRGGAAGAVGRPAPGREASALDELGRLLGMAQPPAYIEAYDISATWPAGITSQEWWCLKTAGRLKSAYRKFKIKTVVGQDDYGSMREVIRRRLRGILSQNKDSGEGFGRLPDLILAGRRQGTCGGGEADFGSVWAGHRAVWHGEGRQTPHAGYRSRTAGKSPSTPTGGRLRWFPPFRRRSTALRSGIIARRGKRTP